MHPRIAGWLTRLYPRDWQQRYGAEFAALLEAHRCSPRSAANVFRSAMYQHLLRMRGRTVEAGTFSFGAITRQPSAWLPLAMSLIALVVVFADVAVYGAVRRPDEGAAAHIWQLLIVGQLPLLGFFAMQWLPRAARQTLKVLALHAGALAANFAAVFFLGLG